MHNMFSILPSKQCSKNIRPNNFTLAVGPVMCGGRGESAGRASVVWLLAVFRFS